MKKVFVIVSLLVSSFSQADIIKCSFTEPFITTIYSMSQSAWSGPEKMDTGLCG